VVATLTVRGAPAWSAAGPPGDGGRAVVSGAVGAAHAPHRRDTVQYAVWAVQAVEEQPPAGCDAIEWVLLITCAVHTPADAVERVDCYACRWGSTSGIKGSQAAAALKPGHWRRPTAAALPGGIQRPGLAPPLCHPAEPGPARGAVYRPVGARGMASALRRHACHRHAAGDTAPLRQAVHWIGRLGAFSPAVAMEHPA